jgi:hypothetical protein
MSTPHPHKTRSLSRRALLQAGLAADVTLSAWPLAAPGQPWGAEAGQPMRGGILRIRGWDPGEWPPVRQAAAARAGSGTDVAGAAATSCPKLSHC